MNKTKFINFVLWLAYFLAMAASIKHLAWTFGTMERAGNEWFGWIPAIAVDTGLAALAYTIQQRKRLQKSTRSLWLGLAGFSLISAAANMYHALFAHGTTPVIDLLQVSKAAVLSATLPLLVIYLGEIVSSDDAHAINKAEQERQRQQAREEREQRRREQDTANEAKRLELEAKRLEQPAPAQQPATGTERTCKQCGNTFKNRQAYAAHACMKKHSEPIAITAALAAIEQTPHSNGRGH